MKFIITSIIICFVTTTQLNAQSIDEEKAITATIMDYIDGTADAQVDRIKNAFHPDLNLYSIRDGEISITNGKKYISYFEDGKKRNRIGKIISIDYVNDAAIAKLEIETPNRVFTDYLLLLKAKGKWQIIHKSYTSKAK